MTKLEVSKETVAKGTDNEWRRHTNVLSSHNDYSHQKGLRIYIIKDGIKQN